MSKVGRKVGRFVLDSEEVTQPLPDLPIVVERWLRRDVDPVTAAGYRVKIEHFVEWYAERSEFCPSEAASFVSYLRSAGYSESNIFDIVRRCKQFFRWLHNAGITPDFDCSKWFPAVRVDKSIRVPAPLTALAKLMEAARNSAFPVRNQAILATMLGTGIRRAECASLMIEDVVIEAGYVGSLVVRKAKRVKGRSIHQRTVAFDASTGKYLCAWLDEAGRRNGPLWASYSFMADDEDSLTPQGIYKVVRGRIDAAGLTGVIAGCHDLRRLFITYYRRNLRGDAYDKLLGMQVGHSSSGITDRYDLSNVEDMKQVLISPLALLEASRI